MNRQPEQNQLWAPWRIRYLRNFKKEMGCLFCRVTKEKKDRRNLIILRSRHAFAMLNLYPYNNGHLLVSPIRHVKTLELLKHQEILDLFGVVSKVKRRLDKRLAPEGYNIGCNIGRAAGAGFDQHLHLHIVPRWNGDTNFMPVIGNAKIVSQSLNALYRELVK